MPVLQRSLKMRSIGPFPRTLLVACLAICLTGLAHSALSLVVSDFTPDSITVSISGSFDSDVAGDQRYIVAIKPDWSSNDGAVVDWIDGVVTDRRGNPQGWGLLGDSSLTLQANTLAFEGWPFLQFSVALSETSWGDSIYISTGGGSILAGTAVSGSFTVSGAGAFDPSAVGEFELVSGFDESDRSWNRLEARVPEPSISFMLGVGAAVFLTLRSRRRQRTRRDYQKAARSESTVP